MPADHASESPGPVNCNIRLRYQNESYPRTCRRCGVSSCPFFNADGTPKVGSEAVLVAEQPAESKQDELDRLTKEAETCIDDADRWAYSAHWRGKLLAMCLRLLIYIARK